MTHTSKKPLQCSSCNMNLLDNYDLLKHMKTHMGEKPFYCNYCDKAFSIKSDLEKHMKTHMGEKPFYCNYCDKSFSIKSDLEKHLSAHTYTNNQCDKQCIAKNNQFRVTINNLLLCLNLPLECGRIVNTDGSCFYDSVIAIIEDPVINQSDTFNARNINSIQNLRLSLANFMEASNAHY